MNNGDLVKVFTQIGSMKKPRWLVGNAIDCDFPELGILVETHSNTVWSESTKVKKFSRLGYDNKTGLCPALVDFQNKNWDYLKNHVSKAMERFFPNVDVQYDDKEKIIYAMDKHITIGAEVSEVESIAAFTEVPGWGVEIWKEIPATRWEPSNVDSASFGVTYTSMLAARLFLNAIWQVQHDSYWDGESWNDEYCKVA